MIPQPGLAQDALDGSARAMIAAAKAVRRGDFAKELDDQLAPALAKITAGCRADK